MTTNERRADYARITKALVDAGYQVINGFGKGGFWVRDRSQARPAFANENGFIPYRKAKAILDWAVIES